MDEPRWPDEIPPPYARLYRLGQRCLDEVNGLGRQRAGDASLDRDLLDLCRSQALAIITLGDELLSLRHDLDDAVHARDDAAKPLSRWTRVVTVICRARWRFGSVRRGRS